MSRDFGLLALAAAIVAAPLMLGVQGSFTGTDDQARNLITEAAPAYRPWFAPLWQPPSKEVESLLFALQAALGGGVLGYVIGRRRK